MTPAQCAGKYTKYTHSLAVCYATQKAVACPAAAAVCCSKNLHTNTDMLTDGWMDKRMDR